MTTVIFGSQEATQLMEAPHEYLRNARTTTASAFREIYPHHFLFKHPKQPRDGAGAQPEIDYATRTLSINFDPRAAEAQVVCVKKKPENPFPDRISIGRATNCDVVIRLAFISKVHAHLFVQGDKLTLRDNQASNGTSLNHRQLESGSARTVKIGDVVSFGSLDLELVDATRLYDILRSGAPLVLKPPIAAGT